MQTFIFSLQLSWAWPDWSSKDEAEGCWYHVEKYRAPAHTASYNVGTMCLIRIPPPKALEYSTQQPPAWKSLRKRRARIETNEEGHNSEIQTQTTTGAKDTWKSELHFYSVKSLHYLPAKVTQHTNGSQRQLQRSVVTAAFNITMLGPLGPTWQCKHGLCWLLQ